MIRLVKLNFQPDAVKGFLELFAGHRPKLLIQQGCISATLLRDLDNPNVFTTLSEWQSKEDLERYRQSPLFKNIWQKVKPYFSERAIVNNFERILLDPGINYG